LDAWWRLINHIILSKEAREPEKLPIRIQKDIITPIGWKDWFVFLFHAFVEKVTFWLISLRFSAFYSSGYPFI
jgi:hypothetical protein